MAHNLTESATYPANVAVPDDGDSAVAMSVETPFQALANRTKYITTSLNGVLRNPAVRLRAVDGDANIYVGELAVWIGGKLFTTVGESAVTTGSLVNATWYYLYCYDASGVIGFEWSTTAPDTGLVFKTGDTTRVYLGCFVAQDFGGPIRPLPFTGTRGSDYRFRRSVLSGALAMLSSGGATTFTDVSFAARCPPHAKTIYARTAFIGAAHTDSAELRPKGDTTDYEHSLVGFRAHMQLALTPGTSTTIQYKVTSGALLSLDGIGFHE